jgi:hypothetical protein
MKRFNFSFLISIIIHLIVLIFFNIFILGYIRNININYYKPIYLEYLNINSIEEVKLDIVERNSCYSFDIQTEISQISNFKESLVYSDDIKQIIPHNNRVINSITNSYYFNSYYFNNDSFKSELFSNFSNTNELLYLNIVRNIIQNKIKYPKNSLRNNISGNIILCIGINEKGEIIKLVSASDKNNKLLEKECISLILKLSPFAPPENNLKMCIGIIPLEFKLVEKSNK